MASAPDRIVREPVMNHQTPLYFILRQMISFFYYNDVDFSAMAEAIRIYSNLKPHKLLVQNILHTSIQKIVPFM